MESSEKCWDFGLIDIILQNGKTGLLFTEKYSHRIKKIMYVTGCVDEPTIDAMNNSPHASASKAVVIWETLERFLHGETPKIGE